MGPMPQFAPDFSNLNALRSPVAPVGTPARPVLPGGGMPGGGGPAPWGGQPPRPIGPYPVGGMPPRAPLQNPVATPISPYPVSPISVPPPAQPAQPVGIPAPYQPMGGNMQAQPGADMNSLQNLAALRNLQRIY